GPDVIISRAPQWRGTYSEKASKSNRNLYPRHAFPGTRRARILGCILFSMKSRELGTARDSRLWHLPTGLRWRSFRMLIVFFAFAVMKTAVWGESEADSWLRYAPLSAHARTMYHVLPIKILVRGDSQVLKTAQQELSRGVQQILHRTLRPAAGPESAFVL